MLYTDHQALLKCLKSEDTAGRIARWQLALSEYDLDVFHVRGKEITIADGLSRIEGYPSARPTPHKVNDTAFMADDNVTAGDQGTDSRATSVDAQKSQRGACSTTTVCRCSLYNR